MNGKEYLAENPKCDVIHSTSDGNLFYNESDAKNHANTLDDKTVETFNQEKKMVETDSKEDAQLLAATGEKVEDKLDTAKAEEPAKVEDPVKAEAPAKVVEIPKAAKTEKPATK